MMGAEADQKQSHASESFSRAYSQQAEFTWQENSKTSSVRIWFTVSLSTTVRTFHSGARSHRGNMYHSGSIIKKVDRKTVGRDQGRRIKPFPDVVLPPLPIF
jgi:hypothetical protein